MNMRFSININGLIRKVDCEPESTLLDVIRDKLMLTGTKRGCNIGACGSCTVLVDGKPKKACRFKMKELVAKDEGRSPTPEVRAKDDKNVLPLTPPPSSLVEITTIEGLSDGDELHPIQQSFIDCGAIQCGFCTPGMVLTAKALLDENPKPTRDEIKSALRGNLCRCTGYQQIFEAVEKAAKKIRTSEGRKRKAT